MAKKIRSARAQALIACGLALALAWVANGLWLPMFINGRLRDLKQTQASVAHAEVALLWREVRLQGVSVARLAADAPEARPVLSVARATLRWRWSDLLRGRMEGALEVDGVTAEAWRLPVPEAPAPEGSKASGQHSRGRADTVALVWSHLAQRALPLSVASLALRDGRFRWHDLRQQPALHTSVEAVTLDGHNLTGRDGAQDGRFAHFRLRAQPAGGALDVALDVAPDEPVPSLALSGRLQGLDLTRANDVLRAYAHLGVTAGALSATMALDCRDGRFSGWVEPRAKSVHIDRSAAQADDSLLERLVRRGAAAMADWLRGGEEDGEIATRVRLSGTLWRTDVGVVEAAVGLLGQALLQSLSPVGSRTHLSR